MADTKISALAAAAALSGSEKIPAVQSGANVAVTPAQIAAYLSGRSWYVANGGSDANSGRSPAAPFQTLAKALAVMATGDTVLLRCGGTFRESFDVSGFGRVTIGSYGAGPRPVIDGADIVTETWTFVSGNVYRVLITVPEAASATQNYPGLFEDGVLLAEFDNTLDGLSTTAARVAAVQAKPGSFNLESPSVYASGAAAGATYSYLIQASDGGIPASNGKLYEVRKRAYPLTHAGALVTGITFRRGSGHNGGAQLLTGATLPGKFTNCLFDQPASHGTIDSLSDYEDCTAMRPNPKYPGRYLFHAYGPAGQANTKRYKRCKAIGDFVTSTAGFGTHSSSGGTSCQKRIVYEDCENIGTTGFGGYDCDYFDYVRPRNRDCISDFAVTPGILGRVIDGDCAGASGTEAITPPSAGKTLQLIRTRIFANTTKAFARASSQNAGTIDVQEGCELLWNGQPATSATTAFWLSDGNYVWDKIKVRRSIVGAIGGSKANFAMIAGASTPMVTAWDVDDCIVGGFLRSTGNNTTYPGLIVSNNGTIVDLTTVAGFTAAVQQITDPRKLYTNDPVRDGSAKRLGANWPIYGGFNAVDAPATGGGSMTSVGKQIVNSQNGYRTGYVVATPTSELFGVKYITAAIAVACGANGLVMLTTNNGASWSVPASSVGLTTATLRGVAFTGTTVIIVGDGGVILRSTDSGTTWGILAAPGGTTDLLAATYGNGKFMAVGAAGITQTSTDGSTGTWTQVVAVTSLATWRVVTWVSTPALFVIGGDGGQSCLVATSAAGATWANFSAIPTFNAPAGIATDGTTVAIICRPLNRQGPELITSTAPATSWIGQSLDLPFVPTTITYTGNSNFRWTIAGRSPVQAFAWDIASQWRYEEMVRTTPAALRAVRSGAEGWLAAA